MTYEEVIYGDKYGVTQKTVPYYVQKDLAQVQVSAVIVTQRVVRKYSDSDLVFPRKKSFLRNMLLLN